jgi:murein DD-endopeptidase MepM/ murein hydrolase activator NlpD
MLRRISTLAFFVAVTGCSQRSPWVAVAPTPAPVQQAEPAATAAADSNAAPADATAVAHLSSLFFPVAGMDSTRLDDSFEAPRDGGVRKHQAIDIMAPRGSAVLAVQDGRILRLSKGAKGGTTAYATDLEERFVYYYAHLDRYHANMYAGRPLMRGDTIGYVGTTGNAPKNVPHLHFQVMRMPADRKYWIGEPINPYPLLRATSTAGQ